MSHLEWRKRSPVVNGPEMEARFKGHILVIFQSDFGWHAAVDGCILKKGNERATYPSPVIAEQAAIENL